MRFHLSWWQTLGYVEISWEFLLSLLWLGKKKLMSARHAELPVLVWEHCMLTSIFIFVGVGRGGGWFVTDSHNRLHWKGQSADSLRFAWWCAFLELLSLYQDIIFQMCMIAKPNSGQVMMTLQQQRYPICFFILTC